MRRAVIAALALVASPALAETPATTATPPAPVATALLGPAMHVTNIERALQFYVDGLGLKKMMQMGAPTRRETMLAIAGDSRPAVILLDDSTNAAPPAIVQSNGFDRLVMRVANLPGVVARLRGMGFAVTDVRNVVMGYSMAMATDPDGYRLELVESAPKRSN